MWTPSQKNRFDQAHRLKNRGDYSGSLSIAYELLNDSTLTPLCTAYIRGCIVAVDLRHLGREEEAEQVFSEEYAKALKLHKAVAAYILNDWSSMRQGEEAFAKVRGALALLDEAMDTPDPDRDILLDRAYFQATLAREDLARGDVASLADLRKARLTLQSGAMHLLKYRGAHFNALAWEVEAEARLLGPSLFTLLKLAVRQRKVSLVVKKMMR
jgi:hypothetical protein